MKKGEISDSSEIKNKSPNTGGIDASVLKDLFLLFLILLNEDYIELRGFKIKAKLKIITSNCNLSVDNDV